MRVGSWEVQAMDIMKSVLENEAYLIEMRRHFHVRAELSDKEDETVKTICAELTKMGISHVDVPHGGVLGFIKGKNDGKTVMLRGDIDALPLQEEPVNLVTTKTCVSENKGVCHACGHDGHAAMLLVAGKILNENKEQFDGTVILMFERGEEQTGNFVYLYKYIRDNHIHIDSLYGTHLFAGLETGKISIADDNVMSGGFGMNFKISGRGGHSSRPDQANNPLDCFVAIYNGFNALRMRNVSPFHTITTGITVVHAGTISNVIPETVEFSGGGRVFEYSDAIKIKEETINLVESTCKAYHCTLDKVDTRGPMLAVKNDPQCAQMLRTAAAFAIGAEHIVQIEPWMASDCVSSHLALWPGVFALVGIRNEEKGTGAPHHDGRFDLDEDALKYGAATAVAYAMGFLASDIDTSQTPNRWTGSMHDLVAGTTACVRRASMLEVLSN
jgi:amidohydrolase